MTLIFARELVRFGKICCPIPANQMHHHCSEYSGVGLEFTTLEDKERIQ